ncbi:MAG: hypothetical protein ACFFD4_13375 [Candidatus Odinarchaeota archaeon]
MAFDSLEMTAMKVDEIIDQFLRVQPAFRQPSPQQDQLPLDNAGQVVIKEGKGRFYYSTEPYSGVIETLIDQLTQNCPLTLENTVFKPGISNQH